MDSTPPSSAQPNALLQIIGGVYILFGSFGLVSLVSNCGLFFGSMEGQTGLMPEMLRSHPSYTSIMRALFLPGLLYSILQFSAGVGLLRASKFARKVAMGCALYGIAAAVLTAWLTTNYTLPFTLTYTLQKVKNPDMLNTTRIVTLASGYIGIVLGLLYPVAAFVLLKRTKVRRY